MPFPLNDGGSLAIHSVIEGFLDHGVALSILAMNTTRHWIDESKRPELYSQLTYFKSVTVDNRVKALDAFLNLFKTSSYNIDRFISKEYERELIQLLQEKDFDIIHLESLFVSPYLPIIRKYSKAKVVMRQHNVEYKIWERMAQQETSFFKKQYLSFLAGRLKKHELKYLNSYDLVLPISQNDAATFQELGLKQAQFLLSFGIHLRNLTFTDFNPLSALSLYHIGAMDWLPNQESVNWFLDKVMPIINQRLPHVKLYLAGRNMPEEYFQKKWENVEVMGEVPDAQKFEKDKSILIVPLQSGGGVRIKIFQAMAMGKAIVTTSIGAEGIDAKDGQELMIADNPEAFAQKIEELIKNPEKIKSMGITARKLIEDQYDQNKIIGDLLKEYEQLIAQEKS